MGAVRDLMNVSPVFAYQFIIALCEYYKKPPDRRRDGADRDGDDTRRDVDPVTWNNGGWCDDGLLPPSMLVDLIADWIIEKPDFCLLNIPRVSFDLYLETFHIGSIMTWFLFSRNFIFLLPAGKYINRVVCLLVSPSQKTMKALRN